MKKVIVVGDIRAVLGKGKSFFDRTGIRTYTVASNEKALALHRNVGADLIIARLDSNEMSGEKLCSFIRDDDELRNVSLIIVSSDREADLERCVQCRANAFISSPVDSETLLQETQKLLNVALRTSCRVHVDVSLCGRAKKRTFHGHIENISVSGILFSTAAALFEGDAVTCSFDLPGSVHAVAHAEIVRVVVKQAEHDTNRYGAKFTELGSDLVSAVRGLTGEKCRRP